MRKNITTVAMALAFGFFTANAQDLTSKKGEPILPEEGDWGIGIDATPFLNYAGNFFGKNAANTAPSWNYLTTNNTIVGKYFKDATTAYRAAIRLGFGSQKMSNYVSDDTNTSTDPKYVQDTKSVSFNGIGLSGGIEMRKGKTRLQGYYGGELGLYIGGSKEKYTYGNQFNNPNGNFTPTSTNWTTMNGVAMASRTTEVKNGSTFAFGLRGFIGAEYFVLPKMSIGGEFGWGLSFSSTGEGQVTTEFWDGANNAVKTQTTKTGKSSSFALDTDNNNSVFGPAASLRLNLYF
ncbi:MAG: hypothetical protein KatS3mg027_1124 [Bacteroidia bacterium]|nr:MAG: hypothetical protein KatS3mg027_1124 [Bacteroidia bacterium]